MIWSLLSAGCLPSAADADSPSPRAPRPGERADEAPLTDDTAASAGDTAGAVEPWVTLVSPVEGATVDNPVSFTVAGEGIDRLVLTADAWTIADWRPAVDGWTATYTFDGTGYARVVTLTGYNADGLEVSTDTITITVAPAGVDLDVPYFYQYDNRYEPSGTCGLTSTAMAINWWTPGAVTPDELYLEYGKAQGQSPAGIASIQQSEGLHTTYTLSGTRDEIRAHLDAGRPVVVHGYWTGPGHITVVVGYDDTHWIVNDPAGDWYVCYACGEADHVRYPVGGDWDEAMSRDGDVWYSTSSNLDF